MLVMVVFFIAFRWIHLSTPLIRLFLWVLILLLMPTLNFLPVWFALSLLRFRLPSRLPMMFILFFQAEDGIRDLTVTGVQTCALPISPTSLLLLLTWVDDSAILSNSFLGSVHPMRSPRPWCFSHPTTAATSRERNCSWKAVSDRKSVV